MSILWNIVRHIHPFRHTALSFGFRLGEAVILIWLNCHHGSDCGEHSCASEHQEPQLPPVTEVFRTDASIIEITASAIVSILGFIPFPFSRFSVYPTVPFRIGVVRGLAHPFEYLPAANSFKQPKNVLREKSHRTS